MDGYFDYIIIPSSQCREDASRTVFGDGQTDVEAITISFWARYTALHGSGTIMRVFATNQKYVFMLSIILQSKFLPWVHIHHQFLRRFLILFSRFIILKSI